MEGFSLVDIYSTKGIEYLIAAVFFFGFLALQRYILTSAPGEGKGARDCLPAFRPGSASRRGTASTRGIPG